VNAAHGPGYLPCPAPDARGIAGPACARATCTTRGRLPWHTLRVNDLRDSSGAGLWYVLAESHRNNPKQVPLNAHSAASLAAAGSSVVAALIAPGAPLSWQRRGAGATADAWVEHGFGGSATLLARADANDRVLLLDSATLADAIGRRAFTTLARALADYRARHGRLTWLLPPTVPDATTAVVGVRGGWLAVHPAPAAAPSTAHAYHSAVTLSWRLAGATLGGAGDAALVARTCLASLPCAHGLAAPLRGQAACTWWAAPGSARPPADHAHCTIRARHQAGAVTWDYTFRLVVVADGPAHVAGPTATRLRTRSLRLTRLAAGGTPAPVFDVNVEVSALDGRRARLGAALAAQTSGELVVADLAYALDVAAGELPAWLVAND
ncbi:MAG: hypothetical protein RLW62_16315, partial [Gammaproteobacteria bacterium]